MLYVSYYFWVKKPVECPEGVSQEDHDDMPKIIGPMLDSVEIPVDRVESLIAIQNKLAQDIQAVKVVIIFAQLLPLGSNIALPQILTPGGRLH